MQLQRSQRIAVNRNARHDKLDIGPQDYFVLSRIEGRPSVGEVIDAAGLPKAQTQEILARLLDAGAIEVFVGQVPEPRAEAGGPSSRTPPLRTQAAARRRRTLTRGLANATRPSISRQTETKEMKAVNDPTRETKEVPRAEGAPRRPPFVLPPVPADDQRLDASLGLDVEEQRRLLAMVDRKEELTPFEMLGLHPTNDKAEIKAAFRQASRRFHPDAHHGRDLGPFGGHLSELFTTARAAVKKLGEDAYREPIVAAADAQRAKSLADDERRLSRMAAAKAAAAQIRDKREQQEVDERREVRVRGRAQAQRGRVLANLASRTGRHIEDAEKAERVGNLAAAANHYRLALGVDPKQADVKAKWEAVRALARKERAKEAFSRANSYLELGQSVEAMPLFVEAAEADPTPEHMANAADLLRTTDAARARELALGALNALQSEGNEPPEPKGRARPAARLAEIHLMIGRAFLTAGQKKTALAQAKIAEVLSPGDLQVRALLNSIKVK